LKITGTIGAKIKKTDAGSMFKKIEQVLTPLQTDMLREVRANPITAKPIIAHKVLPPVIESKPIEVVPETPGVIEFHGSHKVLIGKRGGKYYLNKQGKPVYIKTPKPT
jgi:hypothetical protein